jgi:hypothetical protein
MSHGPLWAARSDSHSCQKVWGPIAKRCRHCSLNHTSKVWVIGSKALIPRWYGLQHVDRMLQERLKSDETKLNTKDFSVLRSFLQWGYVHTVLLYYMANKDSTATKWPPRGGGGERAWLALCGRLLTIGGTTGLLLVGATDSSAHTENITHFE